MAMRIKVTIIQSLAEQGGPLEESIFRLRSLLEGTAVVPPNTPLLGKISDDINKDTSILRILSLDPAHKVPSPIATPIGRFGLFLITRPKS
jgi:hypothetical protein